MLSSSSQNFKQQTPQYHTAVLFYYIQLIIKSDFLHKLASERSDLMKKENLTTALIFIVGTELIGALSALLSGGNFSVFYQSLHQPPLAPPGWLFPVMWAILYALMGFSAYQIYISDDAQKHKALLLYFIQLAVNFSWSIVFFRFQSLLGAVFVILLLLVLVFLMILQFGKIRKSAGWLNLPYLAWVAFATYLTIGIYRLN